MLLRQFIVSIGTLRLSKDFISHHRLWEKWESMKWIYTLFTILAFYFGLKMLGLVSKAFSNLNLLMKGEFESVSMGSIGLPDLSLFSSGMYKYLFLFFTMSLVFHFGGRTLEIIYGIPYRPTWKSFIHSQVRTFTLLFVCMILENISKGITSTFFSLAHINFLKPVFNFLLTSFFFGVVILDTLLEARGFSLKNGLQFTFHNYLGISIFYGALGLLLSYIPIIGIILISTFLTVGIIMATKRLDAKAQ